MSRPLSFPSIRTLWNLVGHATEYFPYVCTPSQLCPDLDRVTTSPQDPHSTLVYISSPNWLEDYAMRFAQAHLKLDRQQQGADLFEGYQGIMRVLQILDIQSLQLSPHQYDMVLANGNFRGYPFRTIMIAERYRANVALFFACRALLVWDMAQQYATCALELAETDETRFSVSWAAKQRLRELLEEARLQERLEKGLI